MGEVIFCSDRALNRAENIKAVYDAYEGEKIFYFRSEVSKAIRTRNKAVSIDGIQPISCIVTDEFLTSNVYNVPVIFIGHGIPGGKTYGLAQPSPYVHKEDSDRITYAISSSPFTRGLVADYCGIPRCKVLPYGMPRTDKYMRMSPDIDAQNVKVKYLYLPTFRRDGEGELPEINWDYLDSKLTVCETLFVKRHMLTIEPILKGKSYEHIKEISPDVPSEESIVRSDVVLTDYSSAIFDAQLFGKPVVLLCPDKPLYLANRGMFLPYPDFYSDKFCLKPDNVLYWLRKGYQKGQTDYEKQLQQLYSGSCDGHSTERICHLIEEVSECYPRR